MKQFLIILTITMFAVNTGNADWEKITSLEATSLTDVYVSGNTIYVSSFGGGIYKSTNGAASWQQSNTGLSNIEAIECNQLIQSGNVLFVATQDGIYRSTDFAANWVKKSDGILLGKGSTSLYTESIFELNGSFFTGAYSGIYRSTNGGDNWLGTNVSGMHIWAKNFTLHNGILFAAREIGNNPTGYTSTNNGITWNNLAGPSFFSTITFFSEPGKLFTGTIHGAWLSTNDGANWIERSQGLSPDPYNSSFIRIGGVLLTSLKFGGSGFFRSFNDGELWHDFSEGLPFLNEINKILLFENVILIATSGGLYKREISEVTGVRQLSSEIQKSFSLKQNYPNPFNPETRIRFSLPNAGDVKLEVLDAGGKIVSILVDQYLKEGTYETVFAGSVYASGVYFFRLTSSGYSETRKMILIK